MDLRKRIWQKSIDKKRILTRFYCALPSSSDEEINDHQTPPDWGLNYQPDNDDYQEENQNCFTTRDLISWSLQIAREMDYIGCKKVLNGNLAARNVLLAYDGIVKVADFGLARQLYNDYD